MTGDYPRFKATFTHDELVEHFLLRADERALVDSCRGAPVFAGKGIEECCLSLLKCNGSHVRSCVCHVSPTFSYRPKSDKSRTSVKNGSDNICLFSLYGTSSGGCQGGD